MRISAIDALQRGLLNLRANPMLAVWQVVQNVLIGIIVLAGLMPLVLALGAGAARVLWSASRSWDPSQNAELEDLMANAIEQWPLLLAALAAAFAVWTVAFLVYCWMQAGILSQLAAGDERAGGAARPAVADFKVYSRADFARAAASRIWKLFWLINLVAIVGLVILFLVILFLSLGLTLTGDSPNLGLAFVVGCLLVLVTFVVFFFLFAWTGVAKAELVVGDRGVMEAFRRSFFLLWRRIGGVLLLLVLFIAASMALGVIFIPVSLLLDVATADSFSSQIVAQVALTLFQTPFNAVLTLVLSAAMVALVRGERGTA